MLTKIKSLAALPRYNYIYGLLSFLIYCVSFMIGYEDESAHHMLILIKSGLIFISGCFFLLSCTIDSDERAKTQYSLLSLIILGYELLLWIAVGKTIFIFRDYPAILNSIVWTTAALIGVFRFRASLTAFIRKSFATRETCTLIISSAIISALVIALSIEPNGIRFPWDSAQLYAFIDRLSFDALYDAKKLIFVNHISVVYAYILVLFKLLLNDIALAFFVLNTLCIIAASFGMTFLFKALVPGKKAITYVLADALFLFSPWVCGMSTYYMYDYYIWCLFPLLVCYYARRNWLGFFAIGVMISFSRSPGLILFGGLCFGVLISDLLHNHSILYIIKSIKYWFFASVAIVFFLLFTFKVDSSDQFMDTSCGLNPDHILHLTKEYITANFLWLFFGLSIASIIYVFFISKTSVSQDTKSVLFSIVLSDLFMYLFYCIFITYRIPRYMDSHIAAVYICGILFLVLLSDRIISWAIMALLLGIQFISSFRMWDPVSMLLFNSMNVGDHRIVDFEKNDKAYIEDAIICNREYYSYPVLADMAMTYIVNSMDPQEEILFSLGNQNLTWGLSGGLYSYGYGDNKHYFTEFYDTKKQRLAIDYQYDYYSDPDMTALEIHYIFPQETLEEALSISDANSFYYLYMPTINEEKESEITEKYNIINEENFNFRGWQMNCIKFSR